MSFVEKDEVKEITRKLIEPPIALSLKLLNVRNDNVRLFQIQIILDQQALLLTLLAPSKMNPIIIRTVEKS